MHQLALDTRIRDWVLLPIFIVLFLFGILRHYVTLILRSKVRPDPTTIRRTQTLQRAQYVRENAGYIPSTSFNIRRSFFTKKETGILQENIKPNTLTAMTDPTNMVEMMKNNMATVIPNIIMLGWVSYFYSGFVVAKFPFPLTGRFRNMVQRGIELSSLDVSYVTSASIYFLFLFGLRGLFALTLGEDNAVDDAQMMQRQMMGAAPGGMDFSAAFKAERENLDLVQHKFLLEDAEERLLTPSHV